MYIMIIFILIISIEYSRNSSKLKNKLFKMLKNTKKRHYTKGRHLVLNTGHLNIKVEYPGHYTKATRRRRRYSQLLKGKPYLYTMSHRRHFKSDANHIRPPPRLKKVLKTPKEVIYSKILLFIL